MVRRSDEGCSATQKLDFLRSRQYHLNGDIVCFAGTSRQIVVLAGIIMRFGINIRRVLWLQLFRYHPAAVLSGLCHTGPQRMRSLKNVTFFRQARKVRILTGGIHYVFRGLKFEAWRHITGKWQFCKGHRIWTGDHIPFGAGNWRQGPWANHLDSRGWQDGKGESAS